MSDTSSTAPALSLDDMKHGERGRILSIRAQQTSEDVYDASIALRLLELGIMEGAEIEALHRSPFGGDPISVKVDRTIIALRRAEARTILIERVNGK